MAGMVILKPKKSIREWAERAKKLLFAVITSTLLVVLLNACSGSGGGTPEKVMNADACAALANTAVPAGSIGLPTTGAVVTSATWKAASGTGTSALPDYCLVSGDIKPVDPTAWNIQFKVALPSSATWNSKVVMVGGAGFDGSIPSQVEGRFWLLPASALTHLGRGYAVFGSDGGHQAATLPHPAAFVMNQEAYNNWAAGDALKKTRDTAIYLMNAAYGKTPTKSYFLGISTGGREALQVAGRWPADWDGISSLCPARIITSSIGFVAVSRALAAPGAYPNQAKRAVLYNAALAACDSLDGVSDGVISNVQACNYAFEPSTALLNGVPVRCPGGVDTGDTCLSDAQITALNTINSPVPFNFSLASGDTSMPGYNVYTTDTGTTSLAAALGFGTIAPGFPVTAGMPMTTSSADSFVRYMVTGNLAFNYLTFDPSNPGPYANRLSELSALDVGDRDLSGFRAKGGKVLLMHGTADMLISPRYTEYYFQRLQATMGSSAVDSFLRFYMVPGFGHSTSATFAVSFDALAVLENWVERGVDPANNQIVTDIVGVPGRTRPLCMYPTFPKYKGSGDVNSAASYTCAAY